MTENLNETIDENKDENKAAESLVRRFGNHLTVGAAHIFPFAIGGGLLIALSYLCDDYSLNPVNFGANLQLAKFFHDIGGVSLGLMFPVFAGFVAQSVAGRSGLVAGFVGGAIAENNGSGLWNAIIAGLVAGYAVDYLKTKSQKLPDSWEKSKEAWLYPFFGVLIMGFITLYIIVPPATEIKNWSFDTLGEADFGAKVMMGAIVAGMMALDLGGPVGMAAYAVGMNLLANGEFHIPAAIMAGAMTPPLVIAAATTFWQNKFTDSECRSGRVCYLLGLASITQGAVPFAAQDPFRVIFAYLIGSATSGAMVTLFGCTLFVPCGGIFALSAIGAPLPFFLSLAIGATVGAAILAMLKKPRSYTNLKGISKNQNN